MSPWTYRSRGTAARPRRGICRRARPPRRSARVRRGAGTGDRPGARGRSPRRPRGVLQRPGRLEDERVVHQEQRLRGDGGLVAAGAGRVRVGEVEGPEQARQVQAVDGRVERPPRRAGGGQVVHRRAADRPVERPEAASSASRVASKSSRRRFIRQSSGSPGRPGGTPGGRRSAWLVGCARARSAGAAP